MARLHGIPWNAATGRQTWLSLVGTPITYGCIMLTNFAPQVVKKSFDKEPEKYVGAAHAHGGHH